MLAPVLVFAIGNESRGDDALGPLLLRELDAWLISENLVEKVELLEEFQLQIEHILDMKDRKLVLFIDAGMDISSPYLFYRATPCSGVLLYSHALTPEALLKIAQGSFKTAPDAFVLCIQGDSFELGDAPTAMALENLSAALGLVKKLMVKPDAGHWDRQCLSHTA